MSVLTAPARTFSPSIAQRQIGRMNVLAISGDRTVIEFASIARNEAVALSLPVASGYSVRVTLAANDTYTVERVMKRGAKVWVKGIQTDVYAEDLGEVCYQASCFRSNDFGGHTV